MQGITLAQLFAGCGATLVVLAVLAFAGSQMRNVTDAQPVRTT
jgi:hypothetical protein